MFRPEFLNRMDEIIVFSALTREDMGEIADIILRQICERALTQLDIRLQITPQARAYLAEQGYDKKYGARSLKRTVQSLLENEMSEQLLSGQIHKGDTVQADVQDGKLVVHPMN